MNVVSMESIVRARRCLSILALALAVLANGRADAAGESISLKADATPFFDITASVNHQWATKECGLVPSASAPTRCGQSPKPYGAHVDGPLNPYRWNANSYFQIPHSENYRIRVPDNDWEHPTQWSMEGDPASIGAESPVRAWIFSVRNIGGALYALTHNEWYGYPTSAGTSAEDIFRRRSLPANWWIASVGWMQATLVGKTFHWLPRLGKFEEPIVSPEPSKLLTARQKNRTFGFMHPSNVVSDGRYYYFFASSINYTPSGEPRSGVVLFRSASMAAAGWSFWNGSGWTPVSRATYQGNMGPQQPMLLWQVNGNAPCSHLYALNVRRYKGKWIILGTDYCAGWRDRHGLPTTVATETPCGKAVFSVVSNLASPTELGITSSPGGTILGPGGHCITGGPYVSFFDTSGGADDNYQELTTDTPAFVINDHNNGYLRSTLNLSGF